VLYDEYANKWVIDKEYIVRNFPKTYYKLNLDGSIDVSMTAVFINRKYILSSRLLITAVITISLGIFLTILLIKREKINA